MEGRNGTGVPVSASAAERDVGIMGRELAMCREEVRSSELC